MCETLFPIFDGTRNIILDYIQNVYFGPVPSKKKSS